MMARFKNIINIFFRLALRLMAQLHNPLTHHAHAPGRTYFISLQICSFLSNTLQYILKYKIVELRAEKHNI